MSATEFMEEYAAIIDSDRPSVELWQPLGLLCCRVIAQLALLERETARLAGPAVHPPGLFAATSSPGGLSDETDELAARRDCRPLGNVVRLPNRSARAVVAAGRMSHEDGDPHVPAAS